MAVIIAPLVDELEHIEVRRPGLIERISRPDVAVGLLVALIGVAFVALHADRFPDFAGDEGIYVDQAWAMAHGRMVPYVYTYDHPFLGWLQLTPMLTVAHWLHIGGTTAVAAGRAVMSVYVFATLVLTYGIARRLHLRISFSALAVLVLALSPLFEINARQVYLDNIAMPWVLGAFYLALSPSRRQWIYVSSALLFAVGALSKETVLLFLPALVWVVWSRAYRPTRAMSMTSFVVVGTLAVCVYPLFAVLRNELLPGKDHVSLWTNGIMYQLASRKGSGALWQSDSARRQLLDDWLYQDHFLLLGGVVACAIALAVSPRLRPVAVCFVLWALPVLKPGGYLPAMYVIAALPFAAVLVAGCLDGAYSKVADWAPDGRPRVSALTAAGVCCAFAAALFAPGIYRNATAPGNAEKTTASVERYVEKHAAHDDNILVDDVFWSDLVHAGFGEPWHGVISYYKFDLDPETSRIELPHGWRDIDYVVSTPEMRTNVSALGLPRLAATLQHSTVVASFGSGTGVIEVRRVDPTAFNNTAGGHR